MFDVLCETLGTICDRYGYEWPGDGWQIRGYLVNDEQCWVRRSPPIRPR